MRNSLILAVSLSVVAGLGLAGCKQEKAQRGLEVLPDMAHSPAYESQQAMVVNEGGKPVEVSAMIPPPDGVVARDREPYRFGRDDLAQAAVIANPLLPTAAVLKQGQRIYASNCALCHGPEGRSAEANLAKWLAAPVLNDVNVVSLSDGQLFHIITRGKGRMPDQSGQLLPEQRWAVVHYLRVIAWANLVHKDLAKISADAEAELVRNPDSAAAKGKLAEAKTLAERRAAFAELIRQGGDGHEFLPEPKPRPDYQPPTWPGLDELTKPAAGGGHH